MKKTIAFDTETYLIAPGRLAPRLVCLSRDGHDDGLPLLGREDAVRWLTDVLKDPDVTLVGHNIAFDFGVMITAGVPNQLVWDAYDAGRIRDTMLASQLIAIAEGTNKFDPLTRRHTMHSLSSVAERYMGYHVEGKSGPDVWRTRYRELEGVPVSEYPVAASEYAIEDARVTLAVWEAQQEHVCQLGREDGTVPDLLPQCRYAWALHLMSMWGLRTDPVAVDALEVSLHEHVDAEVEALKAEGIYRASGSKNMAVIKALVLAAYGEDTAPRTNKGAVGTAKEVLAESGDPVLMRLAAISGDQTLLNTYIPMLWKGTKTPLNPRYKLIDTGRVSASKPSIQNQPRRGGARECYVPRDGYVFVAADYHIAELCGLAQILLDKYDRSMMATAIQRGDDLHLVTAASILQIPFERCVRMYREGSKTAKDARQLAKALNFGLPGGLGAEKFAKFAHDNYGVEISITRAKELKQTWLETYPKMRQYFRDMGAQMNRDGGMTTIIQSRSGRVRGGLSYTSACNTLFQGLVADGAKSAVYEVVRECYLVEDSPLFGSRPVAFIHDEIILETPEGRGDAAATRLTEVMVAELQKWTPDVPIRADAHMMRRWYKNAEPAYVDGRLVPWEPKKKETT